MGFFSSYFFDFSWIFFWGGADPVHFVAESAGEDAVGQILCSLGGFREA